MKIRLNRYERVAGAFVGLAAAGCVVTLVGVAAKNNWFAKKVSYVTELESADGVHPGTVVQIAGLRVGSVTSVELQPDNKVEAEFEVLEKFSDKIRSDSRIEIYSPFVFADKVFEISLGSQKEDVIKVGSRIPANVSIDLMDLLSGKRMSVALGSFEKMAESLKILGQAFADPKRSQKIVLMLDRLGPMVDHLNQASVEVTKVTDVALRKQRLETIMGNLAQVSQEIQGIVPAFKEEVPDIGHELGEIVKNMNVLTAELQKLTPAIATVAPELPRTTQRAVEALDETVVTLKAMQRSFLLRGSVESVREEERRPANTSEP